MNPIQPPVLARLLPIGPTEIVMAYEVTCDASFDTLGFTGAWKVPLHSLPWQGYVVARKPGGEKWFIGVNVFREGSEVKYQPFYWLGEVPRIDALPGGRFNVGGAIERLDAPREASVAIAEYPWLTCAVRPLKYQFKVESVGAAVDTVTPFIRPQLAKTTTVTNNGNRKSTFETTVAYEYEESTGLEVHDAVTWNFGGSVSADIGYTPPGDKGGLGWKITPEVHTDYTKTGENVISTRTARKHSINERVTLELERGESKHVSLVLSADADLRTTTTLSMRLRGSIDGQPLPGEELRKLVAAIPNAVLDGPPAADHVVYLLTGGLRAKILADTKIAISDVAPRVVGGELVL